MIVDQSDSRPRAPVEFTPEEANLIIAEIEAMRAEMNAWFDRIDTGCESAMERDAEFSIGHGGENADALVALREFKPPFEILADHERRISALELRAPR